MLLGEAAALAGSLCWATGSAFFTAAVGRLGVFRLNLVRLWIALLLLLVSLVVVHGRPLPEAEVADWLWLALSAVVGLVIGDLFYFGALSRVGPRLTMLLFTLAPPVSAVGEWIAYRNPLTALDASGMAVTLAGVAFVVSDRTGRPTSTSPGGLMTGILFGAAAAGCQGAGLVLSKAGLGSLDALSGTFIRMAFAAPIFTLVHLALRSRLGPAPGRISTGIAFAAGGAVFGPFIGVTLSLAAAKHTHTGVAMTILSTTPITILPYAVLVFHERLGPRTLAGTLVAVAGVALLFLG